MSVNAEKGPVYDPGLCRCCGALEKCRLLNYEYDWMGQKEIYSDMFMDCFGLLLSHLDGEPLERLVCTTCVSRLREANMFRQQVLRCEEQLLQVFILRGQAEDSLDTTVGFKINVNDVEDTKPCNLADNMFVIEESIPEAEDSLDTTVGFKINVNDVEDTKPCNLADNMFIIEESIPQGRGEQSEQSPLNETANATVAVVPTTTTTTTTASTTTAARASSASPTSIPRSSNTGRSESTKASTTEVQTITSRKTKKSNAQRCREYRERKKLQNTMVQNITAERSDECSETSQPAKKPKTDAERRKKYYEAQKLKKQKLKKQKSKKLPKKIPKTAKQRNKECYDRKKKFKALNTLNHHSDVSRDNCSAKICKHPEEIRNNAEETQQNNSFHVPYQKSKNQSKIKNIFIINYK